MATTIQLAGSIGRPIAAAAIPVFRERTWIRWLMLAADALAIEVSLLCGVLLRQAFSVFLPQTIITPENFQGVALWVLLLPPMNLFLDIYPGYSLSPVERLRRRVYSVVGVFGALMLWDYLVLGTVWSRGVLLATLMFALVIPPLIEILVRKLLVQLGWWGAAVVVVGAGSAGRSLLQILKSQPELGMVPIAVLDDDSQTWATSIEGVPVVGPVRKAHALRYSANVAVIAVRSLPRVQLLEWLKGLCFARVIVIPDLGGLQTEGVRTLDLSGNLGIEVRKNLLVPRNQFLKRGLDCCLGVPAFLAAAPFIVLLGLCIKCVSRGPAFYAQRRTGLNGRLIQVWKLRTMHEGADKLLQQYLNDHPEDQKEWLSHFKLKHDPRIIPRLGTFMRRTSLDELPQLVNVLRGEMSLVGPRPFPVYHLAHFSREFRTLRRSVLPGITGLWQISERSNGDLTVQERLDTHYIRNWSVWLDIYLLLRTVRAVVVGSGAC